jgi:hypothetical protein
VSLELPVWETNRVESDVRVFHGSGVFGFFFFFLLSAEIAKSFWTNEELGGKLRLDAVVCVVDSKNVDQVSE